MNHHQHQQFLQRMTMQQQQQQMIIAATRNQSQSSSSTTPGTFQYISQDELLSLYEQRKGAQYFIPEGFEPVLIPRDTSIPPINDNNNNIDNNDNNNNRLPLLQQQQKIKKVIGKNNNKINNNNVNMTMRDIAVSNSSSSTNTTTKTINNNKQSPINSSASSSPSLSSSATTSTSSDVRFPKLVLSRTTATQQTPRAGAAANNNNNSNNNNNNSKPIKQKKPPRPPNAFIIYRRFKQPDIVAKNEGITNNEVSKQVGEMWHREPMEEKLRFQRMADDAKMEHMKKYPEYKYRPRRPHEKRRRTKRPQTSSNGVVNNNNNNADVVADSSSTTDSNNNNINNNNNTNNNNELLIFQPHLHNDHNDIDRRASIDTVSTTETCLDYFGADESRRGSIISLNDFDYGNDFDPLFNDDSHGLLAEEQLTTITSSSSSPSPDLHFNVLSNPGNNICVGSNNNSFNTDALDFLMENVNTPDFSKPDFQFDFFINNFTTTTTTNNNNNNNNNPNDTFDFFDLSGFNLNDSLLMPCDQSIHGDII